MSATMLYSFISLLMIYANADRRSLSDYSSPMELLGECVDINDRTNLSKLTMDPGNITKEFHLHQSKCLCDIQDEICCPVGITLFEGIEDRRIPHFIFGGDLVYIDQFPWMAALGYKVEQSDELDWRCGGSLITSKHVLTAAHCIRPELFLVRLGATYIVNFNQNSMTEIKVLRTIVHEDYRSNHVADIAIIVLKEEAPNNDAIRQISLPCSGEVIDISGEVWVAGWGRTESGMRSQFLKTVLLQITNQEQCKKAYAKLPRVTIDERMMCASSFENGRDACNGDSGGPLMVKKIVANRFYSYTIVGVVSFGFQCGYVKFPGVYTRVSSFVPWIRSKTEHQ